MHLANEWSTKRWRKEHIVSAGGIVASRKRGGGMQDGCARVNDGMDCLVGCTQQGKRAKHVEAVAAFSLPPDSQIATKAL